ncbi:hypothetical protein CEY12_06175 [Chryseobacterium sp. T16E-39]|uniref:hypothetical protein n=1 Tax=Chryseobacterium sp. T16E-39 TaxID=2015076 RepID=UPI000B5B1322|nr:hypothetical protein [Chryseobacterium sp. T16E-39]ASK29715.1 hypothetical protein CEY12_06175 [Chryseobacterium sp. T16E-39]
MNELETEYNKFKKDESRVKLNIEKVDSSIETYTAIAWCLVFIGILIVFWSFYDFVINNTEAGYTLNLYGDFLSGSVGSLWALAGILFLYIAFLGQQQQILYQKIDLLYNSFEMSKTKIEIARQINERINNENSQNSLHGHLNGLYNEEIEKLKSEVDNQKQSAENAFIELVELRDKYDNLKNENDLLKNNSDRK